MRLKDWSTEKNQYEIRQMSTSAFACPTHNYVEKAKYVYKLCHNCFNNAIKSTLQQGEKKTYKRIKILKCPDGGCPDLEFSHHIGHSSIILYFFCQIHLKTLET